MLFASKFVKASTSKKCADVNEIVIRQHVYEKEKLSFVFYDGSSWMGPWQVHVIVLVIMQKDLGTPSSCMRPNGDDTIDPCTNSV